PQVERAGSYDELEPILEEARVDAAYLALPNSLHCPMAVRIARQRVHVLCEKPMAMTVAECQKMIDAAQSTDVRRMIAYRLHFEEAPLRTIEQVRAGELGDVRIISATFSHRVSPRNIRNSGELGGGALFDLGIYCINAARNLFADEPIEV